MMGVIGIAGSCPAALTVTPWGSADQLRARQLSPGPGNSPADVARDQRDRLFGATVAVVAEHGYEATRVADILELAGVSRSAFYRHFSNKQQCFVATLDALAEIAGQTLAATPPPADALWDQRLRDVLASLLEMILAQPAAARLWFVEIYSAGPEAVDRIERLADRLEDIAFQAFDKTRTRSGMPRHLIRAILGGLRQIIHTRLRHDREEELLALAPELLAWALSYRMPPEPLRRPRRAPPLETVRQQRDEPRARIVDAITDLAVDRSYHAMTINEIARRAAVSLTTFYRHFDSKDEAFVAAIEEGERRLIATTLPHYESASDWPHAVKDGLHAVFAFLARNPTVAQLGGMNIFAGSPRALERHEKANRGFQALLFPGYREHPGASPIAGEAIGGSISALLYQHLRRGGTGTVYELAPTATFLALAPFMGTDAACAIANEEWAPARR